MLRKRTENEPVIFTHNATPRLSMQSHSTLEAHNIHDVQEEANTASSSTSRTSRLNPKRPHELSVIYNPDLTPWAGGEVLFAALRSTSVYSTGQLISSHRGRCQRKARFAPKMYSGDGTRDDAVASDWTEQTRKHAPAESSRWDRV